MIPSNCNAKQEMDLTNIHKIESLLQIILELLHLSR